ncbi:MAG: hypothetical protein IJ677_04315 [Alphaproteobacteria bacterium]|nr:hypothetical protein [Alphaproteobacteria bacterium]
MFYATMSNAEVCYEYDGVDNFWSGIYDSIHYMAICIVMSDLVLLLNGVKFG